MARIATLSACIAACLAVFADLMTRKNQGKVHRGFRFAGARYTGRLGSPSFGAFSGWVGLRFAGPAFFFLPRSGQRLPSYYLEGRVGRDSGDPEAPGKRFLLSLLGAARPR